MNFLAVIISLLILRLAGSAAMFQLDGWLDIWLARLHRLSTQPAAHFMVAVVTPCVVVWVGYALLGRWLWGSVELLLSVLVLLYSLGRGTYKSILRRYQAVWREQTINFETMEQIATELSAQCAMNTPDQKTSESENSDLVSQTNDSIYEQHYRLRELFFYVGFERVFTVLFWFAILGPVAALFYRITSMYYSRTQHAFAVKVLFVLEWPAARIAGLCYGLVGDFARLMQAWLSLAANLQVASGEFINATASAALNFQSQWLSHNFIDARNHAELAKFAADEVGQMLGLYNRAIVCMLVFVALFEIIV